MIKVVAKVTPRQLGRIYDGCGFRFTPLTKEQAKQWIKDSLLNFGFRNTLKPIVMEDLSIPEEKIRFNKFNKDLAGDELLFVNAESYGYFHDVETKNDLRTLEYLKVTIE